MSEMGVFAVDRGIWDHPLFSSHGEPFSRREAWLWMICEAAWKDRQWRVGGEIVTLRRGQLCHSVRYLAQAWNWKKTTVSRFLGRLETETMIGTECGTGVTVITLCNYDEYQRVALPSRDRDGDTEWDSSGTAAGQNRNIKALEEEDMSETGGSDPSKAASRAKSRGAYPEPFEAAWSAYPTDANMSKKKAAEAWAKLSPEDQSRVTRSIPAFKAYCAKNPTYRPVHMVRYITDRRFDGHLGENAAPAPVNWELRLNWARRERQWGSSWGPMPFEAGCTAPAEVLLPGDGAGWTIKLEQRAA